MRVSRSAQCTLMRVQTGDGLWLQGLAFDRADESRDTGVLHIHGLAGNFYENNFIEHLAEAYGEKGVSMFSASTRGRDYESDFQRELGSVSDELRIGSAHEILAESTLDIAAWLDGMESVGMKRAIIQGHSLGTLKAVSYVARTRDPRVVGCVLLSPPDMVGIQRERLKSDVRWEELLLLARDLVDAGRGGEYMPPDAFFCALTAASYLDKYGAGLWDIFPIERTLRGDSANWDVLRGVGVPTLVVYGTENEAVVGNLVRDACRVLTDEGRGCIASRVLSGADHVYKGYEGELALTVGRWTGQLLKCGGVGFEA